MHLHSNMVRFIIQPPSVYVDRIPNLHSNMVRFIITSHVENTEKEPKFTFQYG